MNTLIYKETNFKIKISYNHDTTYHQNNEVLQNIKNNQNLSVIQLQKPPPLPLTIPPPTTKSPENAFPDRSALTLDLKKNNNESVLKSILHKPPSFEVTELLTEPTVLNPESRKPTILQSINSNEQLDQLIVQDLKASPKSIYERLKFLKNKDSLNKNNYKEKSSLEPPVITEMDRSPVSSRRSAFLDTTNIPNNQLKTMSTESNVETASNKIAINDFLKSNDNMSLKSDNSLLNSTSLGNSEEEHVSESSSNFDETKNTNDAGGPSSNSKRLNTNVKKVYRKFQKKSPTGSYISPSNVKKKQQMHFHNRIVSDFEIEDQTIFNEDDNDSLSSTGVCAETLMVGSSQKGSQLTLTNRSISNFKFKRKRSFEDKKSNEDVRNSSLALEKQLSVSGSQIDSAGMSKQNLENFNLTGGDRQQEIPTDIYNASSSDIDPDDNILKNLLVKNANIL